LKEFNIKFETPAADAALKNKPPQLKGAENYQRYEVTVIAKEAEMTESANWSEVFTSPIIVDEEEDEVKFKLDLKADVQHLIKVDEDALTSENKLKAFVNKNAVTKENQGIYHIGLKLMDVVSRF